MWPVVFTRCSPSTAIVILVEPLRGRVDGGGGINRGCFPGKVRADPPYRNCAPTSPTLIDMRVWCRACLSARRIPPHHSASIYLGDPDGSGYELGRPRRPPPGRALRRHHSPVVLRTPAFASRHLAGMLGKSRKKKNREISPPVAARPPRSAGLQHMLRTLER